MLNHTVHACAYLNSSNKIILNLMFATLKNDIICIYLKLESHLPGYQTTIALMCLQSFAMHIKAGSVFNVQLLLSLETSYRSTIDIALLLQYSKTGQLLVIMRYLSVLRFLKSIIN